MIRMVVRAGKHNTRICSAENLWEQTTGNAVRAGSSWSHIGRRIVGWCYSGSGEGPLQKGNQYMEEGFNPAENEYCYCNTTCHHEKE